MGLPSPKYSAARIGSLAGDEARCAAGGRMVVPPADPVHVPRNKAASMLAATDSAATVGMDLFAGAPNDRVLAA